MGDAFTVWQDKFNVTIDWRLLPTMDGASTGIERLRIWINSGDMPDVAHWAFNCGELAYTTLPVTLSIVSDDWKERWPNVAKTGKSWPCLVRLWRRKTGRELMCCSAPSLPITGLPSG